MANELAVWAEGLSKEFSGGVTAVRSVSLDVHRGEIFGFLGPNGAGKTTTISMLTTLLRPTHGRAEIDGIDVVRSPELVRRRIGLVFQRTTADTLLTGRENIEIAAGYHGLSPRAAAPRIRELLQSLDLAEAADRRVKTYSGGMQRRLEIAVGIVHEPEILFLDEPTLGLDPQSRSGFWEYIRTLRRVQGMPIFLTTHYLDEADQLADRVAIIDHGSILTTGSPAQLKDGLGGDTIEVRPSSPSDRLRDRLAEVPGVASVVADGGRGAWRVRVARSESMVPAIVRACDGAGIELAGVSTHKPSLDEVFLSLTGREYRDGSDAIHNGPGGPGGR